MVNRTKKRPLKAVRIVVRVENETAVELQKYAVKSDVSVGAVVRRAVREWLQGRGSNQLFFRFPEYQLTGFAE